MSEEKGAARPRQVTMAGVMGIISSVLLVIGLFDTLGRLRTPAMRDVVDEFLAEAPGSSLGLETAQVVDLMRALVFVAGALAAMMLVFAIFVLKRHRGARIGFTVVAALLLLTVPVAGLMPFFLAVAAFLLWSQPARDWYLGRVPVTAGAPGGTGMSAFTRPGPTEGDSTHAGGSTPSGGSTAAAAWPPAEAPQAEAARVEGAQVEGEPRPTQGYGQPQQEPHPAPYPGPYPTAAQAGRDPGKRPTTVTVAAVLTWIGAGTTAVLMLVFVAVLASGGDAFVDEFERAARESDVTLSADQVLAIGWGIAATFLVWSLISMLLAVFAFRRSNAARIALVVSAVMAALLSLVAIMSILSAVTLLLAVATAILLFTGGANQWYARHSGDQAGPPPGHPYAGYPPPYAQQQPQPTPPKRNQPW